MPRSPIFATALPWLPRPGWATAQSISVYQSTLICLRLSRSALH